MSTGLTFGSISAMFGLNKGLITPLQYSILVTTVIASAVIPTLIAQRHFKPRLSAIAYESEDESLVLADRMRQGNGKEDNTHPAGSEADGKGT
jgi:Kef-type K+ transport system membrane component KefB